MLRVGIDVGGTNTDAVLMEGMVLRASRKAPTTANISDGIVEAVSSILASSGVSAQSLRAVMIGTTQFTNALVEAKSLQPVGVLRVALPAARGIPPLTGWPESLLQAVQPMWAEVGGGHRFDGVAYAALDLAQVDAAMQRFVAAGIGSVAVSGVFSPVNAQYEHTVAQRIAQCWPQVQVTCASQMGGLGLLERENAATLNAALKQHAQRVIQGFTQAFAHIGITAPVFISQNDGTLMALERAQRYPVLTFASGPTNSMRGAGYLSRIDDGIVVDVGGTTSDVGALRGGFPRESSFAADVAGVRTNFRMPDVHALGLGGGSRVYVEGEHIRIGPDSVGHALTERALCFGGDTFTLTDAAVRVGRVNIGDARHLHGVDAALCERVLRHAQQMLADAVDGMRTSGEPVPVLLVGGGSVLFDTDLPNGLQMQRPAHADVANAIGAAIAKVSAEVDKTVSMAGEQRQTVLATMRQCAIDAAVDAGALAGTVEIVDVEETPLAYLPGEHARVRVRAVGDLVL